jgi:hypothetical protein
VTVHVISVGLSVRDALRNPRPSLRGKFELAGVIDREKPAELLDAAGAGPDRDAASAWLASALAAPDAAGHSPAAAARLADMAAAVQPGQWPGDISAEVETFARVPGARRPLPAGDTAILVCSDTPPGLVAGIWNALALTGGDLTRVRYLGAPEDAPGQVRGCAVAVRVPGLDAGSESGFRQAMSGLGLLGHNLLSCGAVPGDAPFNFYLSGGFKAAIPYLIGLAEGLASLPETGPVRAYVLHETARESPPILLPLRRMAPGRVKEELSGLTETPTRTAPKTGFLDGYAYQQTPDGWRLTAFGVGLKALFGIPAPPGLGT